MIEMYDIRMEVIFCRKHKEVFDKKVKLKLSDGSVGINSSKVIELWMKSEYCVYCKWKTTFDSE